MSRAPASVPGAGRLLRASVKTAAAKAPDKHAASASTGRMSIVPTLKDTGTTFLPGPARVLFDVYRTEALAVSSPGFGTA